MATWPAIQASELDPPFHQEGPIQGTQTNQAWVGGRRNGQKLEPKWPLTRVPLLLAFCPPLSTTLLPTCHLVPGLFLVPCDKYGSVIPTRNTLLFYF